MEQADIDIPLVVDLDGTIINTDLTVENYLSLVRLHPLQALSGLFLPRARKKAFVAEHVAPDWEHIPIIESTLTFLRQEKARGRKLYLASGSDQRYVNQVAARIGLFDSIFASDGIVNLSGEAKAKKLCGIFGTGRFDYIGNSTNDIPIWQRARRSYIVAVHPLLLKHIKQSVPSIETLAGDAPHTEDYLQALKMPRWIKNLLIFLPTLASDQFSSVLPQNIIAFFAFSFGASACYILNDLMDLRADRTAPLKRQRPIAAGRVYPEHAVTLLQLLLAGAAVLSLFLPWRFIAVLIIYCFSTCIYTLWLRRFTLIDILMPACFYGMRLLAGSAATGIPLSGLLAMLLTGLFLLLTVLRRRKATA